ncbi:MAG: hypothetical protein NXH75_06735 [Halobacteriovoraceae bacterium]|nr:hypothetical protein [Halobacteriovoraceae bacterium]
MKLVQKYMLPCVIFFFIGWTLSPTVEKIIEKPIEREVIREVIVDKPKEAHLKDLQKREIIAKEYYEKAFLLFLANVGLQLSNQEQKSFNQLVRNPQEYLARSPQPFPERMKREAPKVFTPKAQPPSPFQTLAPKEVNFENVPSGLKKKALNNIIKDPAVYYARSKYFRKFKAIKKHIGEYKGRLFHLKGEDSGRVDQIYLKIDFIRGEKGEIQGDFTLQLFNGTEIYSNSNGSGGNGNVRFKENNIIIEGGPGRFFHFLEGNMELAHMYDNGQYMGIAIFHKI